MKSSSRCLYNSSFRTFLDTDPRSILGGLGINYHGDILTTTNEAWAGEITVMQEVLQPWKNEPGQIIFAKWLVAMIWYITFLA